MRMGAVELLPTSAPKQNRDPRIAWLRAVLVGAEALALDASENPRGVDYSPAIRTHIRRMQAGLEDLLEQAVVDGWLARDEAAAMLRQARMAEAEDGASQTMMTASDLPARQRARNKRPLVEPR